MNADEALISEVERSRRDFTTQRGDCKI